MRENVFTIYKCVNNWTSFLSAFIYFIKVKRKKKVLMAWLCQFWTWRTRFCRNICLCYVILVAVISVIHFYSQRYLSSRSRYSFSSSISSINVMKSCLMNYSVSTIGSCTNDQCLSSRTRSPSLIDGTDSRSDRLANWKTQRFIFRQKDSPRRVAIWKKRHWMITDWGQRNTCNIQLYVSF